MFERVKGFGAAATQMLKSVFQQEAKAAAPAARIERPLDAAPEEFLNEDAYNNKPEEAANPNLPVFLFFRH